jgi:ParB-like chromosome segregation protein Spo0J
MSRKTQSKDLASPVDATPFLRIAISRLTPHPDNPRKHDPAQIRAIARSIKTFGFTAPVLVDKSHRIIAGHGRFEAAKLIGLADIPVVPLDHLTEVQARAYMLADNKLTDRSTWDDTKVAGLLKELSDIAVDFDIESTGFELPDIDYRIQSLSDLSRTGDGRAQFSASAGGTRSSPP